MLHSKCLKCLESKANGVLILSVTTGELKKGTGGKVLKLYCIKCEQEILYEMAVALDTPINNVARVRTVPKERPSPNHSHNISRQVNGQMEYVGN